MAGRGVGPGPPLVVKWRDAQGETGRLTRDERSDIELWDLAVGGDGESFGALFERHARRVYNHCFRRTGSWADAEELTSAVFLEAWRRRREVRPIGESALPWLLGVANNLLRNHRRSRRRYQAAIARIPSPDLEPDLADDVAGRLADEVQMRQVLTLVERLPRRHQEVLSLCAWSELSYQEAAVALGIAVGTVRSRLARARARLAELDGNPQPPTNTDGVKLHLSFPESGEEQ